MTRYLPDTTFFIDFERRQPHAESFVRQCAERGDTLSVCLITLAEYYSGRVPGERPAMDWLINSCIYWEMPRDIGVLAAQHRLDVRKRGIQIELPDALIAALAFVRGATVVTENPKDFQMAGLSLLSLRADT